MEVKLNKPVFLNEKGRREYSEDSIFPHPTEVSKTDKIFMVCDGVGGANRGDKASMEVCRIFPKIVNELELLPTDFTQENQKKILNTVLKKTEQYLDEIVNESPQFYGMATTLTYLNFTPFGAIISWAGDSRIYHFRKDGQLVTVTPDHSLVNVLVQTGEITLEEAKTHSKKNVILRAVSGTKKPTCLDVQLIPIEEIHKGDYFLLCSDGILEGVSEPDLSKLLSKNLKLEQIKGIINQECEEKANDNYSMYLLQVNKIKINGLSGLKNRLFPKKTIFIGNDDNLKKKTNKSLGTRWKIAALLGSILVLMMVVFLIKNGNSPIDNQKSQILFKDFKVNLNKTPTIQGKLDLFNSIYHTLEKDYTLSPSLKDSLLLIHPSKSELKSEFNLIIKNVKKDTSEIFEYYRNLQEVKLSTGNIEKKIKSIDLRIEKKCSKIGKAIICSNYRKRRELERQRIQNLLKSKQ